MPIGSLVANLRERRAMSQVDLAHAAKCDPETISQVESGRRPRWSRRTAYRIFKALAEHTPMLPEEAAEFLDEAGLSESLARPPLVLSILARHVAAEDHGATVPSDQTSREMREVHRALSRLLEALGPTKATKLMDAVADAQSPVPGRQPSRELTVVDPPKVPFPGAVEQVHRTYEVTPKPAKPRATRKKRTG